MNSAKSAFNRLEWCVAQDRLHARKRRHDRRPLNRKDANLLHNWHLTEMIQILRVRRAYPVDATVTKA